MHLSAPVLLALVAAAFVAGALDAIGGGGGLIMVPALLAAGLPPHLTLGTNKGQSLFGSLSATVRYARAGMVDGRRARVTFPAAFLGALGGAALVMVIRPEVLRPVVLGLLVVAAILVTITRPRAGNGGNGVSSNTRRSGILAALIALVVGAYDGFFGPGAGTFYIAAFVAFLAIPMARASADAKVANFASNIAAALLFAHRGVILWTIALPLAGGQILGGWVGAHLAIRRGDSFVRAVVLVVVLALVLKVARDLYLAR